MNSPTSYVFKSADDGKTEHINPSIAYVGNGKEVHGADEYDPLGYYVTLSKETRYHLEEGHANFLGYQHKELNDLALKARSSNSMADKAAAWDYFMASNSTYWLEQWQRFEGNNHE